MSGIPGNGRPRQGMPAGMNGPGGMMGPVQQGPPPCFQHPQWYPENVHPAMGPGEQPMQQWIRQITGPDGKPRILLQLAKQGGDLWSNILGPDQVEWALSFAAQLTEAAQAVKSGIIIAH